MQITLCPFCMNSVQTDICPHCGNSVNYTGHHSHLPVGYTLQGRNSYVLGAAKGQGGFGITYIALDTSSGKHVAIKEYYPSHCCGRTSSLFVESGYGQEETFTKGKQHFILEAQMLQSLSDLDSVVKVLDYFEANNAAYLVMEYLNGSSLKDHVDKNGKLPAQEFLAQMKPLMADMEKMHQRGVVHRDIAPDNIIMLSDGRLKLIDFGAARSYIGDKSMTVVVKKGFAPVEQYMRKGSNASTDVYALAATIYYCITGIIPPDSAERQYGDAQLQAPSALGVTLSRQQEQALEKALMIQPAERTQTIQQFFDEIFTTDNTFDSDPAPAKPEPTPKSPATDRKPDPVNPVVDQNTAKSAPAAKTSVKPNPISSIPKPRLLLLLLVSLVLVLIIIINPGCFLGHRWAEETCTTPRTCTACGIQEGTAKGHQYTPATCTEPSVCSICGFTVHNALGHNFTKATCTSPKTCITCKYTEGNALGHSWSSDFPPICLNCGIVDPNTKGYYSSLSGDWASTRVSIGGSRVPPWVFDKEVRNCKQLTLHFQLTEIENGRPFGTWVLYGKSNGKWKRLGKFEVNDQTEVEETFKFDNPESFSQLAAVSTYSGYFNYTFSMWFEDFYLQE